jgi:hypothetical protein
MDDEQERGALLVFLIGAIMGALAVAMIWASLA